MAKSRLHELAERGQSVWIDFLSREFVHGGELQRMIDEDAVTGITSNPSIFQSAIAKGREYDEQMKALLAESDDPTEIFFALAVDDVRDACDVLRPVWEATNGHGRLRLARGRPDARAQDRRDAPAGDRAARRVDRPNVLIKIPATLEGLPAIEDSIARGVSINITLIFSLERYERRRRGLHPRPRAARRRRRRPVEGRVGRVVLRLAHRHRDRQAPRSAVGNTELQGKLGVDNAKLAYKQFQQAFSAAVAGRRSPRRERPCSGRCGPRRRRRTRPTGHAVRRGADRPGHGQHDAARDRDGLPGSRRGARRHGARGLGRGRAAARWSCAEAGVDYDDVVRDARGRGRARSS